MTPDGESVDDTAMAPLAAGAGEALSSRLPAAAPIRTKSVTGSSSKPLSNCRRRH